MPSRMEEIAARSAGSGSEYVANKAANDKLAAEWSAQKLKENGKRESVLKQTTGSSRRARTSGGVYDEAWALKVASEAMVLHVEPGPVTYAEPPVDIVDYSLSPKAIDIPWSQMPAGGMLAGIPPMVGTMMVMLGKRMLVSMAVTGLQFALMEPLQQYGKGLPRATVLWQTGASAGVLRNGVKVKRRFAEQPYEGPGLGYSPQDPGWWDKFWDTTDAVSEWVSEQVRGWFGFPNWLD